MKITWLGHSCFRVETADGAIVFDPYVDGCVPGVAPLRTEADAVLCSHGHRDHGAAEKVAISGKACAVKVETVNTFHDDRLGTKRGKNRIHILSSEGLRLAHLGDLGHMLRGRKLEAIRNVDALLVPIGGHYTIDPHTAWRLAEACGARVVIPMHYRLGAMGFDVIAELSDFTALCGNTIYYPGNTMELTADTPAQTAVLTYEQP